MFGPMAEKVQGNKGSECTLSPFPPAWGGGEGGEGQKYHKAKWLIKKYQDLFTSSSIKQCSDKDCI